MSIRYDKKRGKRGLITLSIILLLLSACTIVASVYLLWTTDLPEEVKKDNAVFSSMVMVGIVFAVYSVFGLFSTCGGCMIYVFSVLTTILAVLFLALSCTTIFACILSFVWICLPF